MFLIAIPTIVAVTMVYTGLLYNNYYYVHLLLFEPTKLISMHSIVFTHITIFIANWGVACMAGI